MSERQSIRISNEEAGIIFGGDSEEYELVDSGHWESGNMSDKYQHATCIVKGQDGYYSLDIERSGSPFTEWSYYFEPYLEPVKQVEVTIKKWVTD